MSKDDMDKLRNEYDNIEVPQELDLAIEKGIKIALGIKGPQCLVQKFVNLFVTKL